MDDNCFYLNSMFGETAASIVRPGQVFDAEKFVIKREDASRLKVRESKQPVKLNEKLIQCRNYYRDTCLQSLKRNLRTHTSSSLQKQTQDGTRYINYT